MIIFFIFVLGLIVGSFLSALTYREPRNISISDGRSKCPKCDSVISWYDNIPLLSYLLLGGKCRNCKKKISPRYPVIEFTTGISFVVVYLFSDSILVNLTLLNFNFYLNLLFLYLLLAVSIAIIVIDIEHQIIPDEMVWFALGVALFAFFISGNSDFYVRVLSGLGAALFLLLLNLVTKGKGMGLGDVKLVLFPGFILGFPYTVIWMFVSFLLGAVIGLILISLKLSKLQGKIAFGPFLLVGFWVTAILATLLKSALLPYY